MSNLSKLFLNTLEDMGKAAYVSIDKFTGDTDSTEEKELVSWGIFDKYKMSLSFDEVLSIFIGIEESLIEEYAKYYKYEKMCNTEDTSIYAGEMLQWDNLIPFDTDIINDNLITELESVETYGFDFTKGLLDFGKGYQKCVLLINYIIENGDHADRALVAIFNVYIASHTYEILTFKEFDLGTTMLDAAKKYADWYSKNANKA